MDANDRDPQLEAVAHDLVRAVNADPRVAAWMKEQDDKVCEMQRGTERDPHDDDGNAIPDYGFGGKGACYQYVVCEASFVTIIKVRCTATDSEIDLTNENW